MPAYRVGYSRRASQDVDRIFEWLKGRSTPGALRWLDALEQAQTRLSQTPLSFPLADEADTFSEPIRQILFRTRLGNT